MARQYRWQAHKWLLVGGGIISAIALPGPAVALCPGDLPTTVERIANRPELSRARLGIQVETLSDEVLFSREGDRFFVPASTLKLLTTAAALTVLGPDYTLQTSVLGASNRDGSTTLQVIGGGDPSFDQADMDALATQLVQQGVQQVDILYGSDRHFPGAFVNPNWEWEDVQAGYGAPVNALIFAENEIGLTLQPQAVGQPLQVMWDNPAQGDGWTIENNSTTVSADSPEFVSVGRDLGRPILRVDGQLMTGTSPEPVSIAEPDPSQAFLDALQATLQAQGIDVQQTIASESLTENPWQELAVVESPTLAALLQPTNQNSNNLYAEALLKTLGSQQPNATDATEAGIAIALQTLATLGLDPQTVVMVDGSGLARKNLITPAAIVNVLQGMARSPNADVYRESLAVAGVSGTLRNRLQNTPAAENVAGKSGAISRNFALAGYLDPPAYAPLVFSIFINNANIRGSTARPVIDDIVLELAALESCSD